MTVACLFGMGTYMKALRGTEDWVFSARERDGGMTVSVRRSGSARPVYTVVVEGYSLGRNIAPLVIDSEGPGLPQGLTRTFEDTTILPGRCTLQLGPLTLDVMPARLVVNGHVCNPGGEVRVRAPSSPFEARADVIGRDGTYGEPRTAIERQTSVVFVEYPSRNASSGPPLSCQVSVSPLGIVPGR